jgi:hypothetical protein
MSDELIGLLLMLRKCMIQNEKKIRVYFYSSQTPAPHYPKIIGSG